MLTIPTLLTFLRILAIPFFVVFFYLPVPWGHLVAASIFAAAGITDWLDGYLARNLHQATRFGAFLDPIADKLVVTTALVLVVSEFGIPYLAIPAAIIVGRELVISGLREWMAELGKRISVAVSQVAKVKTVMQIIALVMLMLARKHNLFGIEIIGTVLLYIAAVLTLWSMVMYLKAAWPDLTYLGEGP